MPGKGRVHLDGLAWRLAAGFAAIAIAALALVLIVLERLTTSAFADYVSHVGMMRAMMGAAPELPDPTAFTDRLRSSVLLAGAGGTVLAAGAGLIVARRLTRPLAALDEAAQQIAAGNTGVQVPVSGDGELHALAESFNTMAAALSASSEARKQFLASVAHELRTPLTILQGEIEALQDGLLEPGPEALEALAEEVRLLGRVVGDLQTLSLADAGELRLERAAEPAGPLLASAVAAVRDQAGAVHVTLETAAPLPSVSVDRMRIEQVLRNLLANALRHTPPGGSIRVVATREGDVVRVAVEDTGPGLDSADLSRVFDRFYRAPSTTARTGSGLGLTIVRELVTKHGGTVRASNLPGAGARFEFTLPVADGAELSTATGTFAEIGTGR